MLRRTTLLPVFQSRPGHLPPFPSTESERNTPASPGDLGNKSRRGHIWTPAAIAFNMVQTEASLSEGISTVKHLDQRSPRSHPQLAESVYLIRDSETASRTFKIVSLGRVLFLRPANPPYCGVKLSDSPTDAITLIYSGARLFSPVAIQLPCITSNAAFSYTHAVPTALAAWPSCMAPAAVYVEAACIPREVTSTCPGRPIECHQDPVFVTRMVNNLAEPTSARSTRKMSPHPRLPNTPGHRMYIAIKNGTTEGRRRR